MAELKPSRYHQALLCFFFACALYAIVATPIPAIMQLACAVTVVCLLILKWPKLFEAKSLQHQEDTGLWVEKTASGKTINGMLIPAGYRSAGLLVLVLQQENDHHYRVVVWRDSVARCEFSYLHLQLAYATRPARRRSLSAFLSLR
ncbi:MAG: protein YgfX [Granulosicoccus sp.]